jgi:conjugal transfer pilus assembly protein TraK
MIRLRPEQAPLLLLLALSLPASALQVVDAKDGETVFAKISQKELTRIAFERGRVRKVTGNAGEFVLEKDEDKGQVFIRPAQAGSTKPINLFVTSERGTVALLLQPIDAPSDSIVIREGREAGTAPSRVERSGRHVRTIKNLLLAMATDALPEDMEIRETARELALRPDVRLTLQRVYLGSGIVGEKYQLANIASADLTLREPELYKSGVMAVSLEQRTLRPGEATNLFVIRERQAHD